MKLRLAMTALLLLLPVSLLALGGCGSDQPKAKELLGKADEVLASVKTKSDALEGKITATFGGLLADLQAERPPDTAAFITSAGEIKTGLDELVRGAGEARSIFEQMKKLNGVKDYKDYADLQLQIIDLNASLVNEFKTFLDGTEQALATGTFNPQATANELQTLSGDIQVQSQKVASLTEKAESLRTEKKL